MHLLILDTDACGCDLAWRAVQAGHEVKWWIPPSKDRTPSSDGIGFPGVERVSSWQPHMQWAKQGVIVNLFNDRKLTKELDKWRAFGFPIFGPSSESAELEHNRGKGMKFMEAHGIEVPAYHTFKTLDECIKFAWKAQEPFVFKVLGDEIDKSLSFVASDPADLVGFLEMKRDGGLVLKGECILQEKVNKICDMGVSGWIGKDGFLPDKWNINFEHKKLMPGDFGPNCFTPDAEVLTREGWKFWPEVTDEDEICTLKDGEIVYDKPTQIVIGDFDDELIGWQSPYVDLLVTPGHNLYVQDDHARKPYFFESAALVEPIARRIARGGGQWIGKESDIAGQEAHAALLGIYIADGYAHKGQIVFGNCPPHKLDIFTKIIEAAGYGYSIRKDALVINLSHLAESFACFGLAHQKYIPQTIKDAPLSVIHEFLRGYGAGDGTQRENNLCYTTVSKRLADDLQELCLKAGWAASIRIRDRVGESHIIKGYECVNRRIAYDISVSKQKIGAEINPSCCYREKYTGKVYCVTVPSHVIYVRRNGKACWSGQTGEMGTVCRYVSESILADEMLKPFEESLVKLGHIGDFDIEVGITDSGKAIPYEFSARFGWPSTQILMASHTCDPVPWMRECITTGNDLLTVDDRVAMGVIMARPPFPSQNEDAKSNVGYPITGIEDVWDHVSPWQMMIGEGPIMMDGKIVKGSQYKTTGEYICVVTGHGADVHDAQATCYAAVDKIKFADRIVRNDVGNRLEKELPKLKALGYEEVPDF